MGKKADFDSNFTSAMYERNIEHIRCRSRRIKQIKYRKKVKELADVCWHNGYYNNHYAKKEYREPGRKFWKRYQNKKARQSFKRYLEDEWYSPED